MADYFTNFSFILDLKNEEQVKWWEDKLNYLQELEKNDGYLPEDLDEKGAPKDGAESLYDIDEAGAFSYYFELDKAKKELWCRDSSGEGSNIDNFQKVLQEYIKEMIPDEIITYQWGGNCSKPRTDAYCGGAVGISKDRMRFMYTGEMERMIADELNSKLKIGNYVMEPRYINGETYNEIRKVEFDELCKQGAVDGEPMVSTFGDGEHDPYTPDRHAYAKLKDGRLVWAWVRGTKVKE
jgi:hypothetical protein